MPHTNPYQTPTASIEPVNGETYKPRLFALSGRIGRLRYLAYNSGMMLLINLLFVFIGSIGAEAGHSAMNQGISLLVILIYILMLAASLVYAGRRLNDLNHTRLFSLLLLIPLINLLLLLYLTLGKGTEGANRFGPAPCDNPLGVKILGWLLPGLILLGIVAAIALPAYVNYMQRTSMMP